jgi:hypothetical protein
MKHIEFLKNVKITGPKWSPMSEPSGQTGKQSAYPRNPLNPQESTRLTSTRLTGDPALISVSTDDLCDDLQPVLSFVDLCRLYQNHKLMLFGLRFDCCDR